MTAMDDRIKSALEIIAREFGKTLRAREVARRSGVSASYFRRLFKEATGLSFKRYVRAYRVARGNELMSSDPTKRVKDLSGALGYKYVSSLDRDYSKCCGRSPRSVKKSLKSRFG